MQTSFTLIKKISQFSRPVKQIINVVTDAVIVILTLKIGLSVRYGYWYQGNPDLELLIYMSPVIAIPIFSLFGLYRNITRHIDIESLWPLLIASSVFSVSWTILGYIFSVTDIPRSLFVINLIFLLFFLSTLRILTKFLINRFQDNISRNRKKILIYGAGSSGIGILNALQLTDSNVSGFIDDNPELAYKKIKGLNIYPSTEIQNLIEIKLIDQIIVTIPSLTRERKKEIKDSLSLFPVEVLFVPSLSDITSGKEFNNDLKEVGIHNLLERQEIKSYRKLLAKNIKGKKVLVTGAGGTIGSELCRQISIIGASELVMLDHSEIALYNIDQELNVSNQRCKFIPILCSVKDKSKMEFLLNKYKFNTIYHAAAYKHVPLVECNLLEGVKNNVFGTLNCAMLAAKNEVENFILISTDKAVRPTNIMGATKRVSELILQRYSGKSKTIFSMVRFGNVLGSSGSVIPLFRQQIIAGGPLTVTHKDVVRYFMTVSEAVALVIQSGAMSKGGEVFLLEMGEPQKIYNLAKKMIKLSGLTLKDQLNPDGDIEIEITGLRPGEKLYEELLIGSNSEKTKHKKIYKAIEEKLSDSEFDSLIRQLKEYVKSNDEKQVITTIQQLVKDFNRKSNF